MKGLVLAAGKGTRLRPLTAMRSKPLVPVANQPLISYPLQKLLPAGITEIGIVVGDNADELRHGLRHIPANLSYIRQAEPQGLAHAVWCAREFCAADDFCLLFCDNLFSEPLSLALHEWERLRAAEPSLEALIHTMAVADPRAFGVAIVEDGWAVEMEEKPAQPKSNLAIVGIDFLTPLIFEAIPRIKPSARGELEITDAIFELTRLGRRVRARPLSGFWFDTGTFADLINVLPPIMDEFGAYQTQGRFPGSELHGPVGIERDALAADCQLTGPVLLAAGTEARDCVLGPYVAVGAGCRLAGCTLSHCQVYPGTELTAVTDDHAIYDGATRVDAATPPAG